MSFSQIVAFLKLSNWLKNLLIITPAFFGMQLLEENVLLETFLGVFGFCLLASGIYVINDLFDKQSDQHHPVKKFRPIASGAIGVKSAIIILIILLGCAFTIAAYLDLIVIGLFSIYLTVNIFYSLALKKIPILDLACIGSGFVIRILVGAAIANISASPWLLALTLLMAVFLPLVKRKNESFVSSNYDLKLRTNASFYGSLNYKIVLPLYALIIAGSYFMFSLSEVAGQLSDSKFLWVSSFPVAIALLRFTFISLKKENIQDPIHLILRDWIIVLMLVLWISVLIVLYYY
jgi:decaprenyl-phosphate phosphoribosyltransferase